jgi:hypothetical protein
MDLEVATVDPVVVGDDQLASSTSWRSSASIVRPRVSTTRSTPPRALASSPSSSSW